MQAKIFNPYLLLTGCHTGGKNLINEKTSEIKIFLVKSKV